MTVNRVMQASFSGGILGPRLWGRIDLDRYPTCLADAKNFLIGARGGIFNRPGTDFVNPINDQSKEADLIPFEFGFTDGAGQNYDLEMGDAYMRVIKDGGLVLESGQTITGITEADPGVLTISSHGYSDGEHVYISGVGGMVELNGRAYIVANATTHTFSLKSWLDGSDIDTTNFTTFTSGGTAERVYTLATPWAEADVPALRWTQSADTLTVVHPSYPPYEITRTDHDNWSVDLITFAPATSAPTGVGATAGAGTANTYSYKVTAVDEETGEESLAGLNATDAATISAATKANPVKITATGHNFETGDEVFVESVSGMTEINDRRFIIDYVDANNFTLRGEDGTGHTTYSSGGTATPTFDRIASNAPAVSTPNVVAWTAVSGANLYSIYKADDGGFYGFIGSAEALTFNDTGIAPDASDGPPRQKNPFDSEDNYPGVVNYFQQRQAFGRTNNKPQTIWLTQSGHYKNMAASQPLRDDDALEFTIASSQVNAINNLIGIRDNLLPLTKGAEWAMITGDQPLSASNPPKTSPQSFYGSSSLPALQVGDSVLFVHDNLEQVRDLKYTFESDAYGSGDLTVLASHLFEGYQIKRWAYAQSPNSQIWAVRDDGVVLVLTYYREHQVVAWTWLDFGGEVESISVHRERPEDTITMIVKRTIDGNTCRFIEQVHTRRFDDIMDAYFVDCGITIDTPVTISGATQADPVVVTATSHGFSDGDEIDISDVVGMTELNGKTYLVANKTTHTFELTDINGTDIDGTGFAAYSSGGKARLRFTEISGLWWLEGETVAILANGNVDAEKVVTGGAVTLTNPASRVQIGLPYNSDLITLPIGSIKAQGRLKKITELKMRVHESRSIEAGYDFDNLTRYQSDRDWDNPQSPLPPKAGTIAITIDEGWEEDDGVYVRQANPLPLTILAMLPEVEASG